MIISRVCAKKSLSIVHFGIFFFEKIGCLTKYNKIFYSTYKVERGHGSSKFPYLSHFSWIWSIWISFIVHLINQFIPIFCWCWFLKFLAFSRTCINVQFCINWCNLLATSRIIKIDAWIVTKDSKLWPYWTIIQNKLLK